MALGCAAHQCQADAFALCHRAMKPLEGCKHFGEIGGRNAEAIVAHIKNVARFGILQPVRLCGHDADLQHARPGGIEVGQRIADQIAEHLLDGRRVGPHERQRSDCHAGATLLDRAVHGVDHPVHDAIDVHRLHLIIDPAGPAQAQERIDDVGCAHHRGLQEMQRLGDVLVDDAAEFGTLPVAYRCLRHSLLQIAARVHDLLAESLQVHQWRAQIVRHAVDEHFIFLGLLTQVFIDHGQLLGALLEFLPIGHRHPVGFGQATAGLMQHFIEPGNFIAAGQWRCQGCIVGQALCVRRQCGQPAPEAAGEKKHRKRRRQQRADHRGDQHRPLPLLAGLEIAFAPGIDRILLMQEFIEVVAEPLEHEAGAGRAESFDQRVAFIESDQRLDFARPGAVRLGAGLHAREPGLLVGIVRHHGGQLRKMLVDLAPQLGLIDIGRGRGNDGAAHVRCLAQHGRQQCGRLADDGPALGGAFVGVARSDLRLQCDAQQQHLEDAGDRHQQHAFCKEFHPLPSDRESARSPGEERLAPFAANAIVQ